MGTAVTPLKEEFRLDAALVEGFVTRFLLDSYQNSLPIEDFHREWWDFMCEDYPYNALAAPRAHSKSTSITIGFAFAGLMFRRFEYVLIVSRSWGIAIEFLRTIKQHLMHNEKLRKVFRIKGFNKEAEDDFIVEFEDGHEFRVVARGMEQSLRGLNWGSKRPDLLLCDDMEDDEAVLSSERREKQMDWFLSALMPVGSDNMLVRIVGTVLHTDSMLEAFLRDPGWHARRYEAHDDDFENILWPRKFSRDRLQHIRGIYISQGRLDKYNMEYRNRPTDSTSGFFQRADFVPANESDKLKYPKLRYMVGGDFAISTKTRRDYTCFIIAGVDDVGTLYVVEVVRMRGDGKMIVDEMFRIEETYRIVNADGLPLAWYIEEGSIRKALGYALELQMKERGVFLNLYPMNPGTTEKKVRAMPIQARMRAKAVKFDLDSSWYYDFRDELLAFDRGKHDDQVDAMAWLGIGLSQNVLPMSDEEEEYEEILFHRRNNSPMGGRNRRTGY